MAPEPVGHHPAAGEDEGDLREEARSFYRLWYQVDLGEAELDRLLEWSNGKPPQQGR